MARLLVDGDPQNNQTPVLLTSIPSFGLATPLIVMVQQDQRQRPDCKHVHRQVCQERVLFAIREGQGSFDLS